MLYSDVHLMEIDLLRNGAHAVAAPLVGLPSRDEWDYIVSLYRALDRSRFPYWLVYLSERQPELQVPLLPGDPDVILDLQAAFDHAFLAGRYAGADQKTVLYNVRTEATTNTALSDDFQGLILHYASEAWRISPNGSLLLGLGRERIVVGSDGQTVAHSQSLGYQARWSTDNLSWIEWDRRNAGTVYRICHMAGAGISKAVHRTDASMPGQW